MRLTPPLTPTEAEIVRLIAAGQRNSAIAAALGVTERTIKKRVISIFRKLDVGSRCELVMRLGSIPAGSHPDGFPDDVA
jgi:DNA-binding NarL/FixJ family response regulator